jgi:hypothetical protein
MKRLLLLFSFYPLLAVVILLAIHLRPYYCWQTDVESDYYYNAKLIHAGKLPLSTLHPGTPVQYISAGIMAITGDAPRIAQSYFNISYIILALLQSLLIAFFARKVYRHFGNNYLLAFICLMLILAAPSFYTFLLYLSPENLSFILSWIALLYFWIYLDNTKLQNLVYAFVFLGISLTVKFSVLPILISMLLVFAVYVLRQLVFRKRLLWKDILIAVLALGISFFIFTVGVYRYMPVMIRSIIQRTLRTGSFDRNNLLPLLKNMLHDTPIYFCFILAGALLLLWVLLVSVKKTVESLRAPENTLFEKILLSGLLFLFFIVTASKTEFVTSINVDLRNAVPCLIFIPFTLFLVHDRISNIQKASKAVSTVIAVVCVVICSLILALHIKHEKQWVSKQLETQQQVAAKVKELNTQNLKLSFWDDDDNGGWFGPASFHYWGNFRYAGGLFDKELTEAFPTYSFIKFRKMHFGENKKNGTAAKQLLLIYRMLGMANRKPVYTLPQDSVFSDGNMMPKLAFFEADELKSYTFSDLERYFSQSYTATNFREFTIGDKKFLLMELKNKSLNNM